MITNKKYVNYEAIYDSNDLWAWINDGSIIYSNQEKYREYITILIRKKEESLRKYKTQYRNRYCHQLITLIPYEITKDRWNDWVDAFAKRIDKRFVKYLYCYKFHTVNKANYVTIIFFTRDVIPKKEVIEKYNQDYFYDKKTGKRCSGNFYYDEESGAKLSGYEEGCVIKSNPNAILKAKSGDVKTDKNGNQISKVVETTGNEINTFRFKSFETFINKLKKKSIKATKDLVAGVVIYSLISKETIKQDTSSIIRKAKIMRNIEIDKINSLLMQYQDAIEKMQYDEHLEDIHKKLNEAIRTVNKMIHTHKKDFSEIRKFLLNWWNQNILFEG